MTTTGRKAACVVMFVFIACCAIASATRFVVPATAAGTPTGAAEDHVPPNPEDGPQRHGNSTPAVTTATRTERPDALQLDKAPRNADSERTIVLHGKVLGPGDRPIAGARLSLSVDEWTDPVEQGMSDVNGAYRLAVPEKALRRIVSSGFLLAECHASLIATADGLGPGWEELPEVKGGRMGAMKPEYAHDFHLAADFPIAGRIVGADGKPVAGAVVSAVAIHKLADRRWYKMHPAIKAGNPGLLTRPEIDPNHWFSPLYPTAWRMLPPATTDSEGRFQIAGVGRDRAIKLGVDGPGIRSTVVSVLTRDDVADFTAAVRGKYPRTREPDGYFYPPRNGPFEADGGVLLFGPLATIDVDPARTVAGVVRDASTGQPITGLRVAIAGSYGVGQADRHGRYRILRMEDRPSIWVYAQPDPERYLTVVRRVTDAKGLGEIVADFSIPRGVIINGHVLEAGSNRPIVSAPSSGCHITWPGPMRTGSVSYFPLSTNTGLRGTPAGLYFEGFPTGTANYYVSAAIGEDGRFRIAVPRGPGVLLVESTPGLPPHAERGGVWKESDAVHRLFPYATLAIRAKDDGAPEGDTESLPGFTGPIPLATYHAYRVINPPADATTLDVTLTVRRGPSRVVRFVDREGRPIRGVNVLGLVAPPRTMTVVLDGSEAEILALDPGKPREVIATSNNGRFAAKAFVGVDDPQPRTIRLEPATPVSGRPGR